MKLLGWAGAEVTPPPLGHPPCAGLLEKAEARRRLGIASPLGTAAAAVWDWNRALGADPGLEAVWREAVQGKALAVITGQQPALLGGPLYTLYKLVTAVALARRLERDLKTPCLAVFWLVGDDSDFGEVSSCSLSTSDGRVLKVRDGEVPPGGTVIGALPAARQTALLRSLPALSENPPGERRLFDWSEEAAARGRTWSGMQAALLYRLLPGLPVIFLDGGQEEVLSSQADWLARTAGGLPLVELLRRGEEEARAAGFAPALDPELGRRALFSIEDGRRAPLAEAARPGELVGPNVVLRPVLQDAVLANAVTVCGPAEIRYRAQLGPIYRAAEVPEPLLLPRLKGGLLPGLRSGFLSQQEAWSEAFLDPDAFLAGALNRAAPAALLMGIGSLRERLARELTEIRPGMVSYDPSLGQVLDSAAGKIDFQAQRLRESVEGKARHRLFQDEPRLAHWKEFVRPREEEQERVLSWLTPYLTEDPPEVTSLLLSTAEEHLGRILEQAVPSATAVFLLDGPGPAKEDVHG